MRLAWRSKVSEAFAHRAIEVADEIGVDPNHLMACMAFESGETFSPAVVNKVSGATGLIQFMRPTAKSLGTTTAELARMSAVEQLDYVAKYFRPYRGKLKTIDDLYMAILWPAAVGKPSSYVLFDQNKDKTKKAYFQNKGLDVNKDGQITKAEAAAKPREKLTKGLRPPYVGEVDNAPDTDPVPTVPDEPATPPAPLPGAPAGMRIEGDPETWWIQLRLKRMNYSGSKIDGLWGGKTAGSIAAFLNDWDERDGNITPPKSVHEFHSILEDLKRELTYAEGDGFVRPVSRERAELEPETVKEIAPEVVPQRRGIIATAWAAIVTFVTGVLNAASDSISSAWNWVTGNKDNLPDGLTDPGWLSWFFGKLGAIPASVWLIGGAVVLGFVALGLIRAMKVTTDAVRTGVR